MKGFGRRLLIFWERYSRPINLGAVAVGFAFDLYLAKRPDSIPDNLLLLGYLFVAASIIVILNLRSRRYIDTEKSTQLLLLLLILQFCFGGLANNLLILYGHSGTIGGSFLFVVLLGMFAIGNEFLKSRYAQLRFNIGVYYLLLLTYCIIALPTFVLHTIGWEAFILSSVASVLIIGLFLFILLSSLSKRDRKRNTYEAVAIVAGILCIFNFFYYFNIIPPVPLSLKGIGIYHSLTELPQASTNGAFYLATYEQPPWYVFWQDTSATYTDVSGTPAYCYTAVFAPSGLSIPIVYRWEQYNDTTKKWQVVSTIPFPINGGRAQGYRGWSRIGDLSPGSWRCEVDTSEGQLIGRISFSVVESTVEPSLSTTTL